MPEDFDKNAYGHKTRNALVRGDMSNPTSGYQIFTPIIDQFLVEHLFADIFYRDVLSRTDRFEPHEQSLDLYAGQQLLARWRTPEIR